MNTLEVFSEGKKIKTLSFGDGTFTVGSKDADISLNYPTVSKRHARFVFASDGRWFEDLGSRNGSAVNGASAAKRGAIALTKARTNIVRIGPFEIRVSDGPREEFTEKVRSYAALLSQFLNQDSATAKERLYAAIEGEEERERIAETLFEEYFGNGPLGKFLKNPACREVLVNRFDEIYVDIGQGAGLERLNSSFLTRKSYASWVFRTVERLGRRIDLQTPICEATFEDGSRFHAVLDCASNRDIAVAIRRFQSAPIQEEQALSTEWLDDAALSILKHAVRAKKNIVVSGGTSTGKTSLLNFLCQYLPANERVITIEDTIELSPPVENLVQLQARKANAEGSGEISLRKLVQCALRMRPDRIVVGECRGEEVLEMLQALNTGHPGSMTTLHANSPLEALQRLELLALLHAPNMNIESLKQWIRLSLQLIVQVERSSKGLRYVKEIWSIENGHAIYSRQSL